MQNKTILERWGTTDGAKDLKHNRDYREQFSTSVHLKPYTKKQFPKKM